MLLNAKTFILLTVIIKISYLSVFCTSVLHILFLQSRSHIKECVIIITVYYAYVVCVCVYACTHALVCPIDTSTTETCFSHLILSSPRVAIA